MNDRRLARVSTVLAMVGVSIAGYLTYVHYAGLNPVCGISHGCETVQTSSYSYLAGVPVALLGLLTYLLILAAPLTRTEGGLSAAYGLTLIGFGFSAYLTYREVFTIHAICSWCVSSAIVFMLLAAVWTARALRVQRAAPAATT